MSHDTRAARLTAYITLVVVLLMGVGGLLVTPAVYSARNNTDEVKRGNQLAACRSEARADIDDASTALEVANSKLVGLLPAGIAAAMSSPDSLDELLAEATAARDDLDQALAELQEANARYRTAVELSTDNPDLFLEQCQEDS